MTEYSAVPRKLRDPQPRWSLLTPIFPRSSCLGRELALEVWNRNLIPLSHTLLLIAASKLSRGDALETELTASFQTSPRNASHLEPCSFKPLLPQ